MMSNSDTMHLSYKIRNLGQTNKTRSASLANLKVGWKSLERFVLKAS